MSTFYLIKCRHFFLLFYLYEKNRMNRSIIKFIFFFLFFATYVNAQIKVIWLINPSFEDYPRPGITPSGWDNCGDEKFPEETPPDIHPTPDQLFGVKQKAVHESTYMAMVVRENKTWESVGQTLSQPMMANQCYIFRIKLSQSLAYKSFIKDKEQEGEKDFTEPIVLRIWGGEKGCEKGELLAISPRIKNEEWLNYTFKFTPKNNYKNIVLEAYRARGGLVFPNGNILLDHASPLVPFDCDSEKSVMAEFDWSPYELSLNNLKTANDLRWYVASQGFHLHFGANGEFSNLGKKNIQRIAAAMSQFPNQKLLFYIDGKKKFKHNKYVKKVKTQLDLEELSESQYEVRKMKSKDYEKGWILKGNGFYITVETID